MPSAVRGRPELTLPARTVSFRRNAQHMRRVSAGFAVLLILPCCVVNAAEPAGSLSEYYGFRPLEIFKLASRSNSMLREDFNGDGLTDLMLIDNSHSRLDLLEQRPEPPHESDQSSDRDINFIGNDWRFEHRKLPLNRQTAAVAAADLNGDGRVDLASLGVPDRVVVRLQPDAGEWNERLTYRIPDAIAAPWSIVGGDINGDDRDDLVILAENATCLLYQNAKGTLRAPRKLMNTSGKPGLIQIADLDGDGRNDICYLSGDDVERGLCARFQDDSGQPGPELRFALNRPRAVAMANIDDEAGQEILSIESQTGRVKISKLRRPAAREGELAGRFIQYGFGEPGSGKDRDLAIGDGDGLQDVVVTDPAAAGMLVFRQHADKGLDLGQTFPGLLGAKQLRMVDLDNDGRDEVIVLSTKETTLAVSRFENERLTFPRTIPISTGREPACLDVLDFDRDGTQDIVYVARERQSGRSSYELRRLSSADDGWAERGFDDGRSVPLDLKGSPARLVGLDANHDGRPDFVVFLDLNRPPVVLLTGEDGRPTVVDTQGGISIGKIPAGAMFVSDGNEPTILAAQENFARSLKLDGHNWHVLDQYNAAESSARIVGAARLNLDGKPGDEVVLVDTGIRKLRVLRNEQNVFRPWREVELGDLVYQASHVADLNGDARDDLLLFGRGRFAVLYAGRTDPILKEIASYETKLEKVFFSDLVAGDLNGDGAPDIAVLDSRSHYVVILSYDTAAGLRHAVHFKVFEEKSFQRERAAGADPREAVIADVTADGRDDLILLAHDRVLVYPQDDGMPGTAPPADANQPGQAEP